MFASSSVPRHLVRGALGLPLMVAAFVLVRFLVAVPVGALVGGWSLRWLGDGLVSGAGLALATVGLVMMSTCGRGSLDELSSTVVLYSGQWQTLTVVMFQALEGTGAGTAVAAASLLVLITLVPLALVHRLLRRHEMSLL